MLGFSCPADLCHSLSTYHCQHSLLTKQKRFGRLVENKRNFDYIKIMRIVDKALDFSEVFLKQEGEIRIVGWSI